MFMFVVMHYYICTTKKLYKNLQQKILSFYYFVNQTMSKKKPPIFNLNFENLVKNENKELLKQVFYKAYQMTDYKKEMFTKIYKLCNNKIKKKRSLIGLFTYLKHHVNSIIIAPLTVYDLS